MLLKIGGTNMINALHRISEGLDFNRILTDITPFFTYDLKSPWFFTEFGFLLTLAFFLIGYAFFKPKSQWKLIYLILFSLFFYYKSSGPLLVLFVGVILIDYLLALAINALEGGRKKLLLVFSVIYSLSFLLYFKYYDFVIANLNQYLKTNFSEQNLFLPIGISFYTFQSLSYLIDVYRKEIPPSKNFLDYGFYMTFFPHLVAGPIVRARDFLPQISNPLPFTNDVSKEALLRITAGLLKKLLIADYLAKYVDMVYQLPTGFSGFEHALAMYAYSFQIYFDFSGYSDIAIGIALILGYRLKENFNNPYLAPNITSFWRRWHISLSLWLRDYIYIPLGGNRKGVFLTYIFLLTTMLIGGFWHGADWRFVFWGFAHGMLLIIHKLLSPKEPSNRWWLRGLGIVFTFHCVGLLCIFFRAESIQVAFESIKLLTLNNNLAEFGAFWSARPEVILLLLFSALIVFLPEAWKQSLINHVLSLPLYIWPIILLVALQLILQFRDNSIEPFIYFQF